MQDEPQKVKAEPSECHRDIVARELKRRDKKWIASMEKIRLEKN